MVIGLGGVNMGSDVCERSKRCLKPVVIFVLLAPKFFTVFIRVYKAVLTSCGYAPHSSQKWVWILQVGYSSQQ